MFVLSKVVLFVINPGVWAPALLIAGVVLLWTRWRRFARRLLGVTVVVIALLSVLPVGDAMLAVLEDRFPPVRALEGPVDGIIVLGGTVNQLVTRVRGQPALGEGAERLTEFVALARRFPAARLAFTGGSGSLLNPDIKETEVARLFFARMGLDLGRILFESRSRNTYENALFTRAALAPKAGERWLLITSAAHMPRAVGAFRKAGWDPIPYPVDYDTLGLAYLGVRFDMLSGLGAFADGLREWMGLVAYRLLGRTDSLFPAPKTAKSGRREKTQGNSG